MKAFIFKGLPGSGKSTLALKYASEHDALIISKDKIRESNPSLKESSVRSMEHKLINDASLYKRNIIIDDTNMNNKTLNSMIKFCESVGYEVEVKDMITEFSDLELMGNMYYLQVCMERNEARENPVPLCVLHRMFLTNYAEALLENPTQEGVIIFDIDGTLADLTHRLHYIKQEVKDHESFYKEVVNDSVIEENARLLSTLYMGGYWIICVSGRPSRTCGDTIKWLKDNQIPVNFLLMRNDWDKRDDNLVKEEIYEDCLSKLPIYMVVDDRKRVIDMRESKGLKVLNVGGPNNDF